MSAASTTLGQVVLDWAGVGAAMALQAHAIPFDDAFKRDGRGIFDRMFDERFPLLVGDLHRMHVAGAMPEEGAEYIGKVGRQMGVDWVAEVMRLREAAAAKLTQEALTRAGVKA